ncbi:ubiquitin carboxyl-terminal hydrolase 36 [Episyrphus balteatus]|uniref:ubiquitin carboxyl-terminal hydrolase 36 n=1 Tax=Episyrphus balteatus TaxID=286459 RepID=UPI002485604F|nr:ubiquitin carboxyl-terminal hydrolase 36 [Episyrphus balteatus]
MPVSVVCESSTAANVNAALRDSLANSSYGSSSGGGNSHHDESLQNKLVASAKRVLLTKIEYEEVNNYNQSVLDTLKSKYIVLKPSPTPQQLSSSSSSSGNGNCGKLIHTPAATTTTNSSSSSSSSSNQTTTNNMNGNGDNKDSNQSLANNHHSSSSLANSGDKSQRNNTSELPQPKRILFPRENVQIGWKSSGRKWYVGSGMSNVGNSCYLNSTLQALFHVPSIANWLTSDTAHMERCEEELGIQGGCIICCMSKTLLSSQSQQSCIRPYLVYGKLKTICRHLTVGRQEDAHEFLRYLVEAMEKAYLMRFRHYKDLDQFSKETTPPNQILGGYLKSAVRCLACGYVSTTFQHFEDLLLDIRKADTIDEALEGYFSRERLEDMGYKCESCKKKVSATKQFTLERAPIALCIQLKRFSMLGTKINKQITIRPRLDLSRFASKKNGEQLTYKLVAMVTHLGASQNCGHYTAIGLTESGTYYSFDDSYVRPISVQSVVNTNAYIIFYELEAGQHNGHSSNNKILASQTNNGNHEQSKENNQKNGNSNYNNVSNTENRQNFYGSSANAPKLISKLNTEQRVIGPQLPEYYKNGNSNGFPGNGNKLVNTPSKLSNRPSSLPTGSSKIMIHFKNSAAAMNNGSNATATSSVSSSSATVASSATSSTDKLKILPSESDDDDDDDEKVTTTSNEVSSTTTLPHMPKLGLGSPVHLKEKSAVTSTATTAAVATANTIKSPLKSLVPYESESGDTSADEEGDTKPSSNNTCSSNGSGKSPKKKKKKNEIDLLFKRKSNGVGNSSSSPKKMKTASSNDADASSTHHDFEDDSVDSCDLKKAQSTPPSPPVIKTKTGLWQVTNVRPSNSNSTPSTPDKKYRNPFSAVRSASPVNQKPAPKQSNFISKPSNGFQQKPTGERSEVVNELMKQSHRGYGAPVLSWNGNKTELEKEITEEARLQRKREWEEDDENEMDRGRQKKVKAPKPQVGVPGYNPFQEHQSQQNFHQRRWKLINNASNHRYQNTSSNGNFRNGNNNRKMNNFKRFGNKFHQRSSHHQRSNGNYFHRRGS